MAALPGFFFEGPKLKHYGGLTKNKTAKTLS